MVGSVIKHTQNVLQCFPLSLGVHCKGGLECKGPYRAASHPVNLAEECDTCPRIISKLNQSGKWLKPPQRATGKRNQCVLELLFPTAFVLPWFLLLMQIDAVGKHQLHCTCAGLPRTVIAN